MKLKFPDDDLEIGDGLDTLVRPGAGIQEMWLREIPKEDTKKREEMTKALYASDLQFRNLARILREMARVSDQDQHDLSKPNWELRLARAQGYKRALQEVYRMLPQTRGMKE